MGRKKRRKSGKSILKTFYKFVPVVALAAPAASVAMGSASPKEKIRVGVLWYTGWDMNNNRFDFGQLTKGWGAFVASSLVVLGIQKLRGIVRGL